MSHRVAEYAFLVRVRVRSEFSITGHGHEHRRPARPGLLSSLQEVFQQPARSYILPLLISQASRRRPIIIGLSLLNFFAIIAAMIILISNDDGIQSEGILALEESLRPVGEIYTVAPDRAQSSTSHALTLHRPLRVQEVASRRLAVNGTPSDCIKLALTGLLPVRPHLVVSGINKGPNLGDDIIYSGTVSAAIEGALLRVPSIAVSLATFSNFDFRAAAEFTAFLVSSIQETGGIPPETLLNVNVPPLPKNELKGWRLTRMGKRHYSESIVERTDPRGGKYYWIGGDDLGFDKEDGTDCVAVYEGYVSVTPLQVDLTNYRVLENSTLPNFVWP